MTTPEEHPITSIRFEVYQHQIARFMFSIGAPLGMLNLKHGSGGSLPIRWGTQSQSRGL